MNLRANIPSQFSRSTPDAERALVSICMLLACGVRSTEEFHDWVEALRELLPHCARGCSQALLDVSVAANVLVTEAAGQGRDSALKNLRREVQDYIRLVARARFDVWRDGEVLDD